MSSQDNQKRFCFNHIWVNKSRAQKLKVSCKVKQSLFSLILIKQKLIVNVLFSVQIKMAITEKMATAVANLHFLHIFKALIYSLKGNHLVFTGNSEGKLCALCTFLTWFSCYFNFQAGNQAILFLFLHLLCCN